ncbi:hypothetical protein R1sor_009746 [Riccia sorocarpa]|uniref:DUF4166 domain-containing protein n=1 Tax=Riccia sorocarpa TaxID=122646 RepID=A0ABD3HVZ6_9MARC
MVRSPSFYLEVPHFFFLGCGEGRYIDNYLSIPLGRAIKIVGRIIEDSSEEGRGFCRRVREGNGYRIDLEGMYLKPPTFAWFKFPRGTIFDLPPLEEDYVLYERYELVHGAFYLPPEFDLHSDLTIQRADGRRTRLKGIVTMPPGHWFTMIPENKVSYYVERPYTGEDFSDAFITMEGMEFRFPAGSSIYVPDRR